MKRNLLSTIAKLSLVLAILVGSCKKTHHPEDDGDPHFPNEELIFDKESVLPGDVIVVTTRFKLEKDQWSITLGSKAIVLSKFDDHTALFAVPYLAPGTYSVDLTSLGASAQKAITIKSYSPISDPAAEIEKFKEDMLASIAEVTRLDASDANIQLLTSLFDNFAKGVDELTPAAQAEVMFMLNRLSSVTLSTAARVNAATPLMATGTAATQANTVQATDNGNQFIAAARQYHRLIIATVAAVGGTVFAVYAPDPASKIFAVGAGLIGVKFLWKSREQLEELLNLIFNHTAFNAVESSSDYSSQMGQNDHHPIRLSSLSSNATPGKKIDHFSFSRGEMEITASVLSKFSSLSNKDGDHTNEVIKGVFDNTNTLMQAHRFLTGMVSTVRSWFSNIPAMPSFPNPIPDQPKSEIRYTAAENLRIENVSDQQITMAIEGDGQQVVFSLVADGVNDKRDFTFDLVYEDKEIGTRNEKTFRATYDGVAVLSGLSISTGNAQVGEPNARLADPLGLQVFDEQQGGMEGVTVYWLVESGAGTVQKAETKTDINGYTENIWTLGAEGVQRVEAFIKDKNGSVVASVTFGAFWNMVGLWEAYEEIYLNSNQPINILKDWQTTNLSDWKVQSLTLEVPPSLIYKFREIKSFRDSKTKEIHQHHQLDSVFGPLSYQVNGNDLLLRFTAVSGRKDFKILSFRKDEVHLEYVDASNGVWKWTSEPWFAGRYGNRVKLRRTKR